MAAKSMEELRKMLLKRTERAMRVTSDKAFKDLDYEVGEFYSGKQPRVYVRTYALGNTPRVTKEKITTSADSANISFDAYLDQSYVYKTGDKPSMDKVLDLANDGIPWASYVKPTVGKKGFWERAEKKIEKDLEDTMGKFFER